MTKKEKPGNPPNWKHVDRNGKMLEWCVFLEGIYDECNWGTLISLRKLCRKQSDIELTAIFFFKHPIAEATLWDLASPSPLALIPGDWPRWHHFMEKVSPKTPNWEKRHTFCWYPCVNDIGINPRGLKGLHVGGQHATQIPMTTPSEQNWQSTDAEHEFCRKFGELHMKSLMSTSKSPSFSFFFQFVLPSTNFEERYRWFSSILSLSTVKFRLSIHFASIQQAQQIIMPKIFECSTFGCT